MNINDIVNLGNLWDALAAIGTICATFLALFFAIDERKSRLAIAFVWDAGTKYKANLTIMNTGKKAIALRQIDCRYLGKLYKTLDFSECSQFQNSRISLPEKALLVSLKLPNDLYSRLLKIEKENAIGDELSPKYQRTASKAHRFIVKIVDSNGKSYKTFILLSQRDLLERYAGNQLFE